jgi:uncharacterized membrane protein YbjE (DUF340 family)
MDKIRQNLTRREIRSPRSAAIAGIVYSVLMITGMILTTNITRARLEDITRETMATWSGTANLVIIMVPFAGIAFLWFTGVIRDRLGELEDQFFATIFLSSGIIQVLLLFVWGAIFGAIVGTSALAVVESGYNYVYLFGFALMNEIIGNYAVRMAGLYMTAIATLWARTKLAPRWLIIVTYIMAAGFLVAAEWIREARFLFPVWVFVVSVHILVLNYRRAQDQGSEGEPLEEY